MQPGEVLVARLRGGIVIGRCQDTPVGNDRVSVSLGRNRVAHVPIDRVVLATGVTVTGMEEIEDLRRRCQGLASEIDLSEVWEVARDEAAPMSLDDLAELYWGASSDAVRTIALLLHLERESLYFARDNGGYEARSERTVRDMQARSQREAQNAQEAESLTEHLSRAELPAEMTHHQSRQLEYLRGYVVHGDNYTRAAAARSLLEKVKVGTRDLQRLGFDLLVGVGTFSPDEPLELERAGIEDEFPQGVLTEAEAVDLSRALDQPERKDLTAVPAVTVDDTETRDRDDAISLEVESTAEAGNTPVYLVGVHIADAAALIPATGALDQEAGRRIATLYLPEHRITMLPPELSDRVGSLVPGERRPALSLIARVTEDGKVLDSEVVPSVIRSRAALSYNEADQAIADATDRWHGLLAPLSRIAQSLCKRREDAGAINVEGLEMIIKVTTSGDVEVRVQARATPARTMVSELMILSNSLLADFCRREGVPAAYRSQSVPDLAGLPEERRGSPVGRYEVMRRLPPADLDTIPAPHGGLGVQAYIQATSPLRRYPDLVMQRQIRHFLTSRQHLYSPEAIAVVAQQAEVQLRELRKLEEARRRYWFLKYLKQRIPEASLYEAVVLNRRPGRPALLELVEYPFRVQAELPDSCQPGHSVKLRLHGVDLWHRVGQFVYVSDPR